MSSNKPLDFELNLFPVISLLAVLLSFLLLTATWVQIGGHEMKQAMGSEKISDSVNSSELWIQLGSNGDLKLQIRQEGSPKTLNEVLVKARNNQHDKESLEEILTHFTKQYPKLTTALVLPNERTRFEDLVAIMDLAKKSNIADIGVAPL